MYRDKVVYGILYHSLAFLALLDIISKLLLESYTHTLRSLTSNL